MVQRVLDAVDGDRPAIPPRAFAMTGLPRSGTTYLSAVLHMPPVVVTVSDPGGQWKTLYKRFGADEALLHMFGVYHDAIVRGEPIPTLEGTAGFRSESRVDTYNQQKREAAVRVENTFALGMKNPAVFLDLLPLFRNRGMRVVVTVRHPLSVINSWTAIGNRLTDSGRSTDDSFANGASLIFRSAAPTLLERQIELHNHLTGLIIDAVSEPNVFVVRYEDWFDDPFQLEKIGEFLGIEHRDVLTPEPIRPDPLDLSDEAVARINEKCTLVEVFGYTVRDGRLVSEEAIDFDPR